MFINLAGVELYSQTKKFINDEPSHINKLSHIRMIIYGEFHVTRKN